MRTPTQSHVVNEAAFLSLGHRRSGSTCKAEML
jgi:hypothetical protein